MNKTSLLKLTVFVVANNVKKITNIKNGKKIFPELNFLKFHKKNIIDVIKSKIKPNPK